MGKSAFITGVTGQDGAYLARLLLEKGYVVHGGVRRSSHDEAARLDRLGIADQVILHEFELSEPNGIFRTIRETPVDEFYNLAAQSFVGSSWAMPGYAADINGIGVLRILDALRTLAPETRFYQASTSEMFGRVRTVPQTEETAFHPRSPYGAAKAYGHYITVNYRESFGMHASSGILFNHESPLRGSEFVTRKITRGLARLLQGDPEPIALGNLDARRDWGYAVDYVDGMWRMLQESEGDDYVLATGITTSIRDFVRYAANALDIDIAFEGQGAEEVGRNARTGQVLCRVDRNFFRPAEVDLLVGDAGKARSQLGWDTSIGVEALASLMARSDIDLLNGQIDHPPLIKVVSG